MPSFVGADAIAVSGDVNEPPTWAFNVCEAGDVAVLMSGRSRLLFLASVALAGVAGGCAADDTQHIAAGGQVRETSSVAGEGPSTFALSVRDVHLGSDGQELELVLDDLPSADAGPTCAYEVHPAVIDQGDGLVRLNATITINPPYDMDFPSCTKARASATVTLAAPLGERDVIGTDELGQVHRWQPTAVGLIACELPGCDPATGEPPLAAGCDNTTLLDAVEADDVPTHADIDLLGCDGIWAVVDVDVGAGSCPAQEGPNPCAGARIDRLFWQVEDGKWTRVYWSRDPGCGDVDQAVPDFPSELCADLPAPGEPSLEAADD